MEKRVRVVRFYAIPSLEKRRARTIRTEEKQAAHENVDMNVNKR